MGRSCSQNGRRYEYFQNFNRLKWFSDLDGKKIAAQVFRELRNMMLEEKVTNEPVLGHSREEDTSK